MNQTSQPINQVLVENTTIACDGTAIGGTKHPKVFLKIKAGKVEVKCPYCDTVYKLKDAKDC